MHQRIEDLFVVFRQLKRSPQSILLAALTFSLGIGVATTFYSLVETIVLRPLPFPHGEDLVSISDRIDRTNVPSDDDWGVTAPDIRAYTTEAHSFKALGAYVSVNIALSGDNEPLRLQGTRATASLFDVLQVHPIVGRVFTEQEEKQHARVAIISYSLWTTMFGGDQQISGTKLYIDRVPYQVLGVMPREFEFPIRSSIKEQSSLWIPMSLSNADYSDFSAFGYQMVGRLKSGISVSVAQQDVERAAQEIMRAYPPTMAQVRIRALVTPLAAAVAEHAKPLLFRIGMAVVAILLIASTNLTSLLLLRAVRRKREMAIRIALGASKMSILRHMLLEALIIAIPAGFLGVLVAHLAVRLLVKFFSDSLPGIYMIHLDLPLVTFSLVLSIFTGLLCGFAPAISAYRCNPNEALKRGALTESTRSGEMRVRSVLVSVQIGLAVMLATVAGLLLRSYENIRGLDLGFRPDHVLSAAYELPETGYTSQGMIDQFNERVVSETAHLPGVRSAALTSSLPGSALLSTSAYFAENARALSEGKLTVAVCTSVFGDYFTVMGIPLLQGRLFSNSDYSQSPLVAVVNQKLAEDSWPGENVIGRRIHLGNVSSQAPWMTVLGEVSNTTQGAPGQAIIGQLYLPLSQRGRAFGSQGIYGRYGYITLRTFGNPDLLTNTLRRTVRSIDPQMPLSSVQSMEITMSKGIEPRLFSAAMVSTFAFIAIVLELVGVYSLIAFVVALRTREMAIRMALGSNRGDVVALVVTAAAKLAAAGCITGIGASIAMSRILRALLFEIDPLDPGVICLASLLIFGMSLFAACLPARKAASTEPRKALDVS